MSSYYDEAPPPPKAKKPERNPNDELCEVICMTVAKTFGWTIYAVFTGAVAFFIVWTYIQTDSIPWFLAPFLRLAVGGIWVIVSAGVFFCGAFSE